MAITLRRQLDEDEKARILQLHGRKCFASGHDIPGGEVVHFDHIRAFADGGPSEMQHRAHVRDAQQSKRHSSPSRFPRSVARLEEFFSGGDALTLKHLLDYLKKIDVIKSFGQNVVVNENFDGDPSVRLDTAKTHHTHRLYTCPTTGWKYFYATLPVELLDSDDDDDTKWGLQPRYLIFDKVFDLYRHFQRHPVLQPSIGSIRKNRVLLFDGQHKIAALLWNGRTDQRQEGASGQSRRRCVGAEEKAQRGRELLAAHRHRNRRVGKVRAKVEHVFRVLQCQFG